MQVKNISIIAGNTETLTNSGCINLGAIEKWPKGLKNNTIFYEKYELRSETLYYSEQSLKHSTKTNK